MHQEDRHLHVLPRIDLQATAIFCAWCAIIPYLLPQVKIYLFLELDFRRELSSK